MQGFWRGCLDLRGQGPLEGLLTAATQAAMWALAKPRGWQKADIFQAATRFNRFWICGQWIEMGHTFRAMGQEGGATLVITLRREEAPHAEPS